MEAKLNVQWKEILSFIAKEIGVKLSYLEDSVLPSWLCNSELETQEDLQERVGVLASVLKVSEEKISKQISPLLSEVSATRCKGASQDKLSQHKPACFIGEILAKHLTSVFDKSEIPQLAPALELRAEILESGQDITLESVLAVCWKRNIPVAHLTQAPPHAPHAMAVNVDGRCAILLLRNRQHQGWHLFDLAHELGHIMLGHVKPGECILDNDGVNLNEVEEEEANRFALELLTGAQFSPGLKKIVTAEVLLGICTEAAPKYKVAPQWLIVCVGHNWPKKYWGVIQRALNLGWADDNAVALVESKLLKELHQREINRTRRSLIKTLSARNSDKAA